MLGRLGPSILNPAMQRRQPGTIVQSCALSRQPQSACRQTSGRSEAYRQCKRRSITLHRRVACNAADSNALQPAAPGANGAILEEAKSHPLESLAEGLTMLFPVWALISGAIAFVNPSSLNWMTPTQFENGVGLLMLSMGLSLTLADFKKCAANPVPIGLGYLCQFSIMPLLGWGISKALNLPPAFATGLILLSCCPGGQASNVATYVARGNTALSVMMTTASTLAASVMTPLLTLLLAGALVDVPAAKLALSTAKFVLIPTLTGVALNELLPGVVSVIRPAMPLLSLFLTVVLCAVPVAQTRDVLLASSWTVVIPVVLLHSMGYALGYWVPKALKFPESTARTVSIETGMQSAALGFALSSKHFGDVATTVPSAVSINFMVWIGAFLAVYWRISSRGKPVD